MAAIALIALVDTSFLECVVELLKGQKFATISLTMDIARKDQSKSPLQPFHVFLEKGPSVPIEAAGFDHVVNAEELIIFRDPDGAPIEEIYCRAEPVALIVPDSRIAKTHAFSDLQNKVADLTERVERIEKAQAGSQPPSGE